jgi:hypothetical protein
MLAVLDDRVGAERHRQQELLERHLCLPNTCLIVPSVE